MKKFKTFLAILLAGTIGIVQPSLPVRVMAEESVEETTESESGGEHSASYDEEIATNAIPGWPQADRIEAGAAIVMEEHTGAILFGKNIEKQEYPASITKIMTTLLALEKGNLSDTVTFSENAVYSIEYGSSHLGLTEGEQLSLEDCLYGIMMASANEISNAVAEHIGGDIDTFVQMMNDRAAELGCTNTHFVNVHGLHDENHYVCAKDMALITQAALKIEKFREIISTVEYHFDETNLVDEKRYFMNHHKMIVPEEEMLDKDCIGGKTGFTDEAGNTLVTAAQRDGLEVIVVILKENGLYESYHETKKLLDYTFENFAETEVQNAQMVNANTEIIGIEDPQELARIREADLTSEPFTIAETTPVTLPKGVDSTMITARMDFTQGLLTYYYQEQPIGSTTFSYTGVWEPVTEAMTEIETESETETEAAPAWAKEGSILGTVYAYAGKALGGLGFLYERMDSFIKENTVVAAVMGAVLLIIFIPMLLVSVNRSRKYRHIMALREEEMMMRRRLEEEIERKSAAQVEAELKASELQIRLEEEQKMRMQQEAVLREQENADEFYLDEEEDGAAREDKEDVHRDEDSKSAERAETQAEEPMTGADPSKEVAGALQEPEEEFIEVPVDEHVDP
ncbi:MAG: serine hydrolase [Eubacteriales bacterium]|nr:serine hydrolase [Eubacteriales bacterium]